MTLRRVVWALALMLGGILQAPARAQSGLTRWGPEDRVVLSDFTNINSIAVGLTDVFIGTPTAVVKWNQGFQEWSGPFQPPTPDYLSSVFQSLVDPIDNSLWLATPSGWVHFQSAIQLWSRGVVTGRVRTIAFDRANPAAGVYFRTSSGWLLMPRGTAIAQPSGPPRDPEVPTTPNELLRRNPALRASSSLILQTPGMGTARFSAAAESFDKMGWYVGTWGAGLMYLPLGAAIPDRLHFGLLGRSARSVFKAPNGVWVSTNAEPGSPAALTFVRSDLRSFMTLTGSPAFGLRYHQSTGLSGHQANLWVASDIGLVKVPTDGGAIEVFDQTRGLPDNRVLSVVAYRGSVFAGTARGVVEVDDSLSVRPVAPGFFGRAWGLAASADTVWIATELGVRYAAPDSDVLLVPSQLLASPSLQVAARALAWKADTLVALTDNEMLWRDPQTGAWALSPNLSGVLGQLHHLALYRDGFWIAGQRGVAYASVTSAARGTLFVGEDLPGFPMDLVVQDGFLWVGTDAGIVRWRLDAIQP